MCMLYAKAKCKKHVSDLVKEREEQKKKDKQEDDMLFACYNTRLSQSDRIIKLETFQRYMS